MKSETKKVNIAITSHYTGYVWHKFFNSPKELSTKKGFVLFYFALPFNFIANIFIKTNLNKLLCIRHREIRNNIQKYLDLNKNYQVLEIAAGLSDHGVHFVKKNKELIYLELDLKEVVELKNDKLKQLNITSYPQSLSIDLVTKQNIDGELINLNKYINFAKPLIILSEGLQNYLSESELKIFWKNIANILSKNSENVYISDIYMKKYSLIRISFFEKFFKRILQVLIRGKVTQHFENDNEIKQALEASNMKLMGIKSFLDKNRIGKRWRILIIKSN
jgi:O-methyltransferase involved in polyketide biosynthesis